MGIKTVRLNEEFNAPDGNVWWFVNEEGKVKMKFVRKSGKTKEFIPPTLEEVKAYFTMKGYKEEAAIKFHDFYNNEDGSPWKDSNGKLIKDWQMKARGVWFKAENKIQKEAPKTTKTDGFII